MKRILVVDDSKTSREMIAFVLQDAGYQVVTAVDGADAVAKIGTDEFDLVVTDIIMPDMEGIELIRRLRGRYRTTPIFAVSGGGKIGPETYLEVAQACGATKAFTKPLDFDRLLACVEETLA